MRLDELKQLVADAFKDASDATTIGNAAKINAKIDEVEAEQRELLDKNKELLDSYKDAVLHTSVKPNPNIPSADGPSGPVNMNSFMDNWLSTHNADGSVKNN